jgi:hypothetical protein
MACAAPAGASIRVVLSATTDERKCGSDTESGPSEHWQLVEARCQWQVAESESSSQLSLHPIGDDTTATRTLDQTPGEGRRRRRL